MESDAVTKFGAVGILDTASVDCGYCTLPAFWEEEVAYLANRSRVRRHQHQHQHQHQQRRLGTARSVPAAVAVSAAVSAAVSGGIVTVDQAGETVVTASCPAAMTDCTAALAAALSYPGARTVVVPASPRSVWPVLPIQMANTSASDRTIVFQPGVTIRAIRGAFKGGTDSLLTATGIANVAFEGAGARFAMWREDYKNASLYNHSESRMGLQLLGVRQLTSTSFLTISRAFLSSTLPLP